MYSFCNDFWDYGLDTKYIKLSESSDCSEWFI